MAFFFFWKSLASWILSLLCCSWCYLTPTGVWRGRNFDPYFLRQWCGIMFSGNATQFQMWLLSSLANRVDNSEISPVNKPLKTSFWVSGSWIHPKSQKSEVPRGRNSFCCPPAHKWHCQGWNLCHLAILVLVQHRWLRVLYSMPHNPNLCWHILFLLLS